jgi:hypothetical protein
MALFLGNKILETTDELLDRNSSLSQNTSQGTYSQFVMQRHDTTRRTLGRLSAHDDVATALAHSPESKLLQSIYHFLPGDARNVRHSQPQKS